MRRYGATDGTFTELKKYFVNGGTTVKAPSLANVAYSDLHWATKDNLETPFDETVPIESDMTLYAIGREIIEATSASDKIKMTTGKEVTIDLNKYIQNKSENTKDFSFELVVDFLPHGLKHSGNVISGTPTEPNMYFAYFKVTNNSELTLMSFDKETNYLYLEFIVSAPKTLISNLEELKAFCENVYEGKTYDGEVVMLTADIDMYDAKETGERNVWLPIGRENHHFMGTFDGNGYKLTNLYYEGTYDHRGLFAYTGESAVIKNLSVSGSVSASEYVGGIVAHNNGTIENCCSDVTVTASGNYVGGITGCNAEYKCISKCYNTGNVSIVYCRRHSRR